MPYDRNKAAAYNKLIQQGVSEDEAIAQAGITDAEVNNYSIGMNGQMGPLIVGSGLRNNEVIVRDQPAQSTYAQTPARQVTAVTTTRTKTESTETVSGGGTTTIIAGPSKPTPASEAAAAAAATKQAELDQFIKDNPSNFARKRQGLPPLTPEENEAREIKRRELEDQVSQANNAEIDARTPGVPTIVRTPNTTTTTNTVSYQTSVEKKPVQYTDDPELDNAQEEAFADEPEEATNEDNLEATDVNTNEDPAYADYDIPPQEQVEWYDAEDVSPEQDPFEAARLAAEEDSNTEPEAFGPEDVGEEDPFEAARLEREQELNREALAAENFEPEPVDTNEDTGLRTPDGEEEDGGGDAGTGLREPTDEDVEQAVQENAIRERAKQQATFQARYKQPGNQDWRVRLSLSPNAQYLYNAGTPRGSAAGILAPLAATDGVIFPYTPSITTTYSANYEQYDLVHSNYRGVFYKNSRVGDINIRGTFTAQDTNEANYLLAVIHFFRSATKMFYGQDAERGTPPPVCLLNGLGTYQFSDHPVVISSFNYTTPNDVDYIRAVNPNNYGSNLLNRRAAVASNPGGSSLAGLNRLLNAVQNGLSKGALPNVPAPGSVVQTVNNTAGATYVPTKMEIDITLIPVQTRSQVSKQFSLKGFANGQLLKGGFW